MSQNKGTWYERMEYPYQGKVIANFDLTCIYWWLATVWGLKSRVIPAEWAHSTPLGSGTCQRNPVLLWSCETLGLRLNINNVWFPDNDWRKFLQRKIEAGVTRSQYLADSVLLVSCTTRGHAQCPFLVLLAGTYHWGAEGNPWAWRGNAHLRLLFILCWTR